MEVSTIDGHRAVITKIVPSDKVWPIRGEIELCGKMCWSAWGARGNWRPSHADGLDLSDSVAQSAIFRLG